MKQVNTVVILVAVIGIAMAVAVLFYISGENESDESNTVAVTQLYDESVMPLGDSSVLKADEILNPKAVVMYIDQLYQSSKPITDAVTAYYRANKTWPIYEVDVKKYGLTDAQLGAFHLYDDGMIGIVVGEILGDDQFHKIYLLPQVDEQNNVTWVCKTEDIPNDLLPYYCEGYN